MQGVDSSPTFPGSRIFRGIAVAILLAIVAAAFAFNPGGGIAQEPLGVRIAVPIEVYDWTQAAAEEFNRTSRSLGGQTIVVGVDSFSDSEAALDAASRSYGSAEPYAAAMVKRQPQPLGGGVFSTDADLAARTVASTYIVGAVRAEYVEPLRQLTGHDDLAIEDLLRLYDPDNPPDNPAIAVSGGVPMWGAVNSGDYDGQAAIYALASAFQQTGQPDFNDPALADWLKTFYDASPQGRPSFYLVAEDMAKFGPTRPAAAVLPEATALRTAQLLGQKGQSLRVIYPRYAVGEWFECGIIDAGPSDRQQEAAAMFRDFLDSAAGRAAASSFGLRAGDGSADISNAGSLWRILGQTGVEAGFDQLQVVEPASGDWSAAARILQTIRAR